MATNQERIEDLEARVTVIEEAPVEVEGLSEVAESLATLEGQIAALLAAPAAPAVVVTRGPLDRRADPEKFREGQTGQRGKARAARKARFGG